MRKRSSEDMYNGGRVGGSEGRGVSKRLAVEPHVEAEGRRRNVANEKNDDNEVEEGEETEEEVSEAVAGSGGWSRADSENRRGAEDGRSTIAAVAESSGNSPQSPQMLADSRRSGGGKKFVGCSSFDSFELLEKLGEGTFGEVHKAIRKQTREVVALKKVLMHNEKEGIPITAVREIKILKALRHPNIVPLTDMVVRHPLPEGSGGGSSGGSSGGSGGDKMPSVYMVFPYMDHDLMGLMENQKVRLTIPHIKLYMLQLLEGTAYMHRNKILHRDMKASNLLINNEGKLLIADFGLARPYEPSERRDMTPLVVTRWYRPPELLIGESKYTEAIDMWGVGCIFAEMLMKRPLFPGNSDLHQLELIFQMCGTPDQSTWPGWESLGNTTIASDIKTRYPRKLRGHFQRYDEHAADLLDMLLQLNPARRLRAEEALDHAFFKSPPFPARPEEMPKFESSHEYDSRKNRAKAAAGGGGGQQNRQHQQQPPPQRPDAGGGGAITPPHAPNTSTHGMPYHHQHYKHPHNHHGDGGGHGNSNTYRSTYQQHRQYRQPRDEHRRHRSTSRGRGSRRTPPPPSQAGGGGGGGDRYYPGGDSNDYHHHHYPRHHRRDRSRERRNNGGSGGDDGSHHYYHNHSRY